MVFFANAGIAWPKLEDISRRAGESALHAGAHLWRMFAILEGAKNGIDDGKGSEAQRQCVASLKEASDLYQKVMTSIDDRHVVIRPSDLELAAVDVQSYSGFEPFSLTKTFYFGDSIRMRDLYSELMQRIGMLANDVELFDIKRKTIQVAPSAFRMMRQWETLAILGRLIAALNRREDSK
jgi:hypothetical protein